MARATPPKITPERYRHYIQNRMDFRLEQWVMPEPDWDKYLLKDIVEDWQIKYVFEPYDATLHPHGQCPEPIEYVKKDSRGNVIESVKICSHPTYNLFYLQLPKKWAKTTLFGGFSFEELTFARPGWRGYILAGDKDQAGLLYKEVADFFERNPNFTENIDYVCHKDTIYRLVEGRRIASLTRMSSEAVTKSGVGPDFFIFDEMWNQPNRQLWDVVHMGRVAKPRWRGVILTNAGFDTDSICYEIREICRKHTHKNYYYCEPGIEPKKIKRPKWISDDAIEEDRKNTPPNVFQRWHENKWTSKYGSLFPKNKIKTAINIHAKQQFGGTGNYVMAIDAGTNRANFVALICHRANKIMVDSARSWKGEIGKDVDFFEVGEWITTACENFRDTIIVADTWQMKFMLQILEKRGIYVENFQNSEDNVKRLSWVLRDVIMGEYLEIYGGAKGLIKDLYGAEAEQRQYGWRLSRKFDFAITLGMACVKLMSWIDDEGVEFDIPPTSSGEKRKFGGDIMTDLSFKRNRLPGEEYLEEEEIEDMGKPYYESF